MSETLNDIFLPSKEEQRALIDCPGPARYIYFVKRVVDWGGAWGLWDDGWATYGYGADGEKAFPLWPAKAYAERCAVESWSGLIPRKIPTYVLVHEILLEQQSMVCMAVFPSTSNRGVVQSAKDLRSNLLFEGSKYPLGTFLWYDEAQH